MKAINLKTEYLVNPIGIDIKKPLLLWNCDSGIKQKAYRIIAKIDDKVVYDSGKIDSSSTRAILPIKLKSKDRVYWNVILFDENDKEGEVSETAFFEIGLLNKNDWKAKWISGNYRVNKNKRYPVDSFKKSFNVNDVIKARLYITACGIYEAKINNQRVGDFIFAPGFTDPRNRLQYQTYDITNLLKNGENDIVIELADGYYRGSSGAKGRLNTYGKITRLLAQIEITTKDNKTIIIPTDATWNWSNNGPILFGDLKDGEIVDANKEYTYSKLAKEIKYEANLTASNNVFVKENEHFKPTKIIKTPSGKTILEFPQNISGYVYFKVNAHKGDKINLTLGEMLTKEGEFTLKNVQCTFKGKQTPLQEIHYICKEGINEYKPKYFYGGFRYVLIDTNVEFNLNDFEAIAVYSSFNETSKFECSNDLINKLYKNTIWSLKSNSTDIPSDCPTRERMGWTGDSQIFFNTASYLVDYASFSRKHVKDIYDRQWKNGRLPQIAPYAHEDWFMWTMNGSVGWACAGVYIPLRFYYKYGDKRILEDNYEGIIKYAKFMIKRAGKWGGVYAKPVHISHKNRKYFVNCGQSYGEWAEPEDVCAFKWYDFASPHPEESTAYTYFTLQKVLEIASILNKCEDKDLKKIKEYSEGAKKAYQEYVSIPKYSLDTNRQAKLVRPLYMNLLNEEQTKYAKDRLIKALDNYNWRLGTGFLSTPLILSVLENIDIEYAYKLLENEEMPGWLFMPKSGATTIWEAWEGNTSEQKGLASLNHYSKGAVLEWIFSTMCGIKISGENLFTIEPKVGGHITFASLKYNSIYGLVSSSWKKENNKVIYEIVIPPNTSAIIKINGKEHIVNAGQYKFTE